MFRLSQWNLTKNYRRCFGSEAGERVLAHLAQNFGSSRQSLMVAGDPHMTAYLLGQRDVIASILRRVHGDDALTFVAKMRPLQITEEGEDHE